MRAVWKKSVRQEILLFVSGARKIDEDEDEEDEDEDDEEDKDRDRKLAARPIPFPHYLLASMRPAPRVVP
jgi:hypothetical protein